MNNHVLVTYASKYGSTEEIARKIGAVLCRAGLQADVLPVGTVQDVNPYQAVILGSAIYVGKWQKGAPEFLKKHEKALASRLVWLFSSGPSGQGDPVQLVAGKRLPTGLEQVVNRIQPRDITVFHGNINLEKINSMEKFAVAKIVKKPFGDYRDWDMITAWAARIADTLLSEAG